MCEAKKQLRCAAQYQYTYNEKSHRRGALAGYGQVAPRKEEARPRPSESEEAAQYYTAAWCGGAMSKHKKKKKGGGLGDLKGEEHLQAVLLADSFTQTFRPITLQKPKVHARAVLNPSHRRPHPLPHVGMFRPADAVFARAGPVAGGECAHDRLHAGVAGVQRRARGTDPRVCCATVPDGMEAKRCRRKRFGFSFSCSHALRVPHTHSAGVRVLLLPFDASGGVSARLDQVCALSSVSLHPAIKILCVTMHGDARFIILPCPGGTSCKRTTPRPGVLIGPRGLG